MSSAKPPRERQPILLRIDPLTGRIQAILKYKKLSDGTINIIYFQDCTSEYLKLTQALARIQKGRAQAEAQA